jgi:hypothetical protein
VAHQRKLRSGHVPGKRFHAPSVGLLQSHAGACGSNAQGTSHWLRYDVQVREKSPGKYALTIVYRTGSIKHLMITLTNKTWELGDVKVKNCTSLTDLIARLYERAPELDWSTPLTGPAAAETLQGIIAESLRV